jgi:multidrug efflux pump subunit AcrA (membrane-fusion protein)
MNDIPLKQLGLEKEWPRIAALQEEIESLTQQVGSANAELQRLEAALSVARNEDVAAQAAALRGGKAAPKTSREDKVKRELETARRNRDVLQRATEDAQGELAEYRAKHGAALYQAVLEARNEIARAIAEHARAAAARFGWWSDMHYLLKDLTPPAPSEDTESAPMGNSMSVLGVVSTRSSGPARGEVEAMLAYLTSLAPKEVQEESDAA